MTLKAQEMKDEAEPRKHFYSKLVTQYRIASNNENSFGDIGRGSW